MSTGNSRRTAQSLATVFVAIAVVGALAGPVTAAQPPVGTATHSSVDTTTRSSDGPSFVVDLAEDGSAVVTLTLTYDLETDDERSAFRTLEDDSETQADARDRFESRLAAVAGDASDATGRDMTVSEATIDLSVSDDGRVGVVDLRVTWTNLAATDDGALTVTEPFASGFEPDRPFTVRGPEGYERTSASPSPDVGGSNAATWNAGSDLSGFAVTFEPRAGGDDGGSNGGDGSDDGVGGDGVGAPGFGSALALVALAAAALTMARRR